MILGLPLCLGLSVLSHYLLFYSVLELLRLPDCFKSPSFLGWIFDFVNIEMIGFPHSSSFFFLPEMLYMLGCWDHLTEVRGKKQEMLFKGSLTLTIIQSSV